jgi:phage gp36-like protein
MAYCTQDDLLKKIDYDTLVQLTDDHNTGGIVAAIVTEAIADADAEIDGYCGRRHPVPFSTVPAIIKKHSVTIAIKNLYARRRGAPENRRQDYDDAIAFLKDVAKGIVTLGEDDPDGLPAETHTVDIDGPDRIFDRDELKGF